MPSDMIDQVLPGVQKSDDPNGPIHDFINDEVCANGMHADLVASDNSEGSHFGISGNQIN